jgi:DNA-binding winged helix-turn-helix (wHTH) protein
MEPSMRASVSQIILAQEDDFNLGGLFISPSKCQVVAARGLAADGREILQPRIMQVLVALARRRGEVVSRDEMMAVCWGGFAVSDDAINRCIARLRRLSQSRGGFTLETIARVGYQLNEDAVPVPAMTPADSAPLAIEVPVMAPRESKPFEEVVVAVPSWAARHGIVAVVAFVAGGLVTATLFVGLHLL